MYNTFNLFLSSNDVASKSKFPDNNNMEFTINLPHRFRLGKCKVCLKSLSIPSRIYNVYGDNELHFAFSMKVDGLNLPMKPWLKIKKGYYQKNIF